MFGFFVDMLLATNSMQPIQAFIVSISDHAILVYCVIGLYFLITALCGFHPLVSLALLVSMMAPVIQELPALPIAIMLIVAGTSTVMFSPFNVSVSLLADLMKVNPYRITRRNIWFLRLLYQHGYRMCNDHHRYLLFIKKRTHLGLSSLLLRFLTLVLIEYVQFSLR
nr:hypothetical protein [Bacillus pumilus]